MNNSTNISANFALRVGQQREAFRKYQLIPLSIILVVGFLANVMVIHAGAKKTNRLKYSTNSLIINLAAADLGMTIFYIPVQYVEYTIGLQISDWTCKYIIPIRETFSIMSIITVAVLGIVRLLQLHKRRVLSKRLTNFLIAVLWLLAYLTVTLPLSTVFAHTDQHTCDPHWENENQKTIHVAYLNVLLLVLLLITNVCYFCIIFNVNNVIRPYNSAVRSELEQKSQKINILLFFLILETWLSLVPYIIYSMLAVFGDIYSNTEYPYKLWSIMSVLFTSSSAINPVLVLTTNKEYRKEIRSTFYKKVRISPLQQVEVKVKQQTPAVNNCRCPGQPFSVAECV